MNKQRFIILVLLVSLVIVLDPSAVRTSAAPPPTLAPALSQVKGTSASVEHSADVVTPSTSSRQALPAGVSADWWAIVQEEIHESEYHVTWQEKTLSNGSTPVVGFSAADYSVGEGDGAVTITVAISETTALTATVDYATSDGTATTSDDYTAASGTLTFTPTITTLIFTVPITGDNLYENDETIALLLSDPVSLTLGTFSATLTISDDDNPPTVTFGSTAYSVGEGEGTAVITVMLDGATALTATVDYVASDGTAMAEDDYTAASGTLTFAPGTTALTFTVPILDDALDETDETITLTLSNLTHATLGTPDSATLTILDDEAYFYLYLPLTLNRWPPVPDTPVLNSISNPDGSGSYTASWNTAYLAETYTLQEDDNTAFSSPTMQYFGSGTSWSASDQPTGTYYYRVRASNSWGNSGWSNVQSTSVRPMPYEGSWRGTTSQGKTIMFTVRKAAVTYLEIYYTIGHCNNKIQYHYSTDITGNAFSYSGSGPGWSHTIQGTFSSNTSASGTLQATVDDCGGSVDVTWNATKYSIVPAPNVEISMRRILTSEIRRRMNRYELIDRRFRHKYGMRLEEFRDRRVIEKQGYSFEGESDYCDWEMAVTGLAAL